MGKKIYTADRSWIFLRQEIRNYFNYAKAQLKGELKVLEVGCGSGLLINSLASENPSISFKGLDMNRDQIKIAEENKTENVGFVCLDFFKFNSNEKFDIVFTSEVLEHIEKPQKFIKKLAEITQKNGFLIISTPNGTNYPKKLFHLILGNKSEEVKARFHEKNEIKDWPDTDAGHISIQGAEELKNKLNREGFSILKQTRSQPLYGGDWVDANIVFRNLNRIIDKILPRHHFINFGWDLMFLAKKGVKK